MEVGIVTTLEKHIADATGMPKVRAALSKHLGETKRHAAAMKKALQSLGGSHPVIKEGISKVANLAAGLMTSAAADTIVKNAIADFTTEHFEMACYRSLIFTATQLGEKEIAATCKAILKEEEAMAAELESQFEGINAAYLDTLEDGEEEEEDENEKKSAAKASPAKKPTKAKAAPKASRKGTRATSGA